MDVNTQMGCTCRASAIKEGNQGGNGIDSHTTMNKGLGRNFGPV